MSVSWSYPDGNTLVISSPSCPMINEPKKGGQYRQNMLFQGDFEFMSVEPKYICTVNMEPVRRWALAKKRSLTNAEIF
jgi:hypothetical protein